jgi:hypothetical protein
MGDPRFMGNEQRRRMGAESSHLGMIPDDGNADPTPDPLATVDPTVDVVNPVVGHRKPKETA